MKRLIIVAAGLLAGCTMLLAPAPALGLTAAGPGAAARDTVPHVTAWHASTRVARFYTVRHGDTLSSIARRTAGHADRWPALWWANRRQVRNPQAILVGQHLRVGWHPYRGWLVTRAMRAIPRPRPVHHYAAPAATAAAPAAAPAAPSATAAPATYNGGSAEQQCIIAAESGGNSQVMNGTGHYGLYQFSASTWAAHGGNPADFGHASVSEQNAVFAATVAADGYADWAPYDGC